jgi:hypothetical protein
VLIARLLRWWRSHGSSSFLFDVEAAVSAAEPGTTNDVIDEKKFAFKDELSSNSR